MGQNCVAGTTELDEEEGIGLVLYVNSESNLIVWKMSDGTKQENTVPLTTEYQSMLKSEFENKTGVTIGYIIIHRYTEETIDIESSITINSGDTPEETLYIKILTQGGFNFVGEIKPYQNDEYQVLIYGNNDSTKVFGFDNDGMCIYDNITLESSMESYIRQQAESKTGLIVSGFDLIDSPVSKDETLPDWSKYE